VIRVRRTDPVSSYEAAESVQHKARESQEAVLEVLGTFSEGATDFSMVTRYFVQVIFKEIPRQSESGLRTRRKELVEQGRVYDTGEREMLPSGRKAIIWKVSDGDRS
jgi:hypothetical protein